MGIRGDSPAAAKLKFVTGSDVFGARIVATPL
jgi:hypothetical protein